MRLRDLAYNLGIPTVGGLLGYVGSIGYFRYVGPPLLKAMDTTYQLPELSDREEQIIGSFFALMVAGMLAAVYTFRHRNSSSSGDKPRRN